MRKFKDIKPGYYLAPAVIDQRLMCSFKSRSKPSTDYKYRAVKVDCYTDYQLTLPDRQLKFRLETYLNSKDSKSKDHAGETFNIRSLLKCPFALTNWLDRPDYELLKHQILLQDSGGFQLATKKSDFISPEDVLKAHQNVALGVSLDVPLSGFKRKVLEPAILKKLALVTAKTNAFFEASGYTNYLNVNHGATINERLQWLSISRSLADNARGLSIGGLFSATPDAFTSVIVALIKASKYKYFHVLGASSGWQMVALSSIAVKYGVVITSDSSTWVRSSIGGCMIDRNYDMIDVPRKGDPLAKRKLLCRCFACSRLDSMYVYSENLQFIMNHNILMQDSISCEISDFYKEHPDASASVPFPCVKTSLRHVDPYIEGKKTYKVDRPLLISPELKVKSLFGREKTLSDSAIRLLGIADAYHTWFKDKL